MLAALLTSVILAGGAADVANEHCPVMPEEPSEPEFHLVYKGRDVHFCCSTCVANFRKDPKRYLGALPQFEGLVTDAAPKETPASPPVPIRKSVEELMKEDLAPFFGVGVPLFALFLLWRRRRAPTAFGVRAAAPHVAWFVFLSASASILSYAVHTRAYLKLWQRKDKVHFATFYDFGHPPVPARPEQPRSLQSTYYRGNDERNPALFNNGYYLTATFDLDLVDGDGRAVRAGDDVSGRPLFVRLKTTRAKFTAERFFHREAMGPIFLTAIADPFLGAFGPVPDRVGMTEIEEGWSWEALYPIGQVGSRTSTAEGRPGVDLQTATADAIAALPGVGRPAADWFVRYRDWNEGVGGAADLDEAGIEGPAKDALARHLDSERFDGVVYVAQTIAAGRNEQDIVAGSRFHYGIVHDIRVREGKVLDDSDLWMGFLYRSRKVAQWRIPSEQWFDNEPIPEMTAPGSDDPTLLGLDDATNGLVGEATDR